MDLNQIINKKNNKEKLTTEEIEYFVNGFSKDEIDKSQATKFIKAVYENGLDEKETIDLTRAMAYSGKIIDLSDVGECVDKHSTGGVSDTTTLIIVPVLASLGVKVAKMSGRSLGWTGGTADKVEIFDGYDNYISEQEFKQNLREINECLISQSEEIAIADKKIYKLRDETGYVDNISLIASSIMSKKIACGAKVLCLDVKYGNGAFMKDFDSALKLAKLMCKIGKSFGIKTSAVISNMNEPLSRYIGNNLEVYSALKVLNGEENNLSILSKNIVATILKSMNKVENLEQGIDLATNSIKSKSALEKFKKLISSQHGSVYKVENYEVLNKCKNTLSIYAESEGYISKVNAKELGNAVHDLCKLYDEKEDKNQCGLVLNKQKNDYIKAGELLATIHYSTKKDLLEIVNKIKNCFTITEKKGENFELIKEIIF